MIYIINYYCILKPQNWDILSLQYSTVYTCTSEQLLTWAHPNSKGFPCCTHKRSKELVLSCDYCTCDYCSCDYCSCVH